MTRDGPYLVSGCVPVCRQTIITDPSGDAVRWRAGRKFKLRDRYALCRCGQTKSPPFCDESHGHTGFDGTETASRNPYLEQARALNGPALRLTDAVKLCASARFCLPSGGTWNLTRRSRHPDARDRAVEQAGNCPAGRLVAWGEDGRPLEPALEPSIGLVEDPAMDARGPLWVRGGIPVISADGWTYETRNRVTLCRCGRSSNKPFCDGSHLD